MLDDLFCIHLYAFDDINNKNDTINKAESGSYLIDKINMARSIQDIQEMRFSLGTL